MFHTKVPPVWLLGIRRDLALLFLNWSIICSCWLISQSRTYYRYESIFHQIILAWLYFVSYLFITLDYWSWYNSHFLKVYNTSIILDVIYVKENSTPCTVSHLQGVWLVCLYTSCLVSSLLMPVVCQTPAAWERHSCVSDPRGKSAADYTGHWAKGNPENGGCTGTGGSFSFWGHGTRGGTHPAGEHTRTKTAFRTKSHTSSLLDQ